MNPIGTILIRKIKMPNKNMNKFVIQNHKNKIKWMKLLFYCALLILPLLQYFLFYVCVNFNMIKLAFSSYDVLTFKSTFVGFDNFVSVFRSLFFEQVNAYRFINSLIVYLVTTFVCMPLALAFSFYINKKAKLSGFFQTILYFPNVISTVALVVIFKYFLDNGAPALLKTIFGISINGVYSAHTYGVILFYTVFTGFGTQVVLYSSAMSGISPSVVEAARVDGVSYFGELIHIALPLIYNTVTTFLIVGFAGFFTNQMNLYTFLGEQTPDTMQTMGVYIYLITKSATAQISKLNPIAAMCLLFSVIAAPITVFARKLFAKLDPLAQG